MAPLTYEPDLVERAAVREIERRRESGDSKLFNEYHRLQEQIHDLEAAERPRAMRALHAYFFHRMGFGGAIPSALAEFPDLERTTLVCTGDADEGAYASPDGRTLLIRVRSDRFADPEGLGRWLRHELGHVADILDPAFGYAQEPLSGPDALIVRDRYALLWAIAVDARLFRAKKAGAKERDERFLQFERTYVKFPPNERRSVFRALWERKRWTHAELLSLASDASRLLALAVPAGRRERLPGAPCPLCKFPTFAWVLPGGRLTPALAASIAGEYPSWSAPDGLCDRCTERAEVRAGTWWTQPS